MKLYWFAPLALGLLAVGARAEDAPPATDKGKTSYAVGVDIGRNLHGVGADVDIDQMVRGLRDGLTGAKPALSDAEIRQLITAYRTELSQKQHDQMQQALNANKEKGEKFQAEYRKKESVVVAPNGIMFRVLKAGDGRKPGETDTVAVNYSGRLVDGTEFDASEAGKPAQFKLNVGVIQGWRDALQQMPVGSKWEIVMPPSVAYGDRGAGRDIPPAATLIFDIELVSIVAPGAPVSSAK